MESQERITQECNAARKQCVLIDHSDHFIFEVTGKDRFDFLHRMVTSDLKLLEPNQGMETCLLNAQGKTLAHFFLFYFKNRLWLIASESLKTKIHSILTQAVIMDDVKLEDKTGQFKIISLHGPKTKQFLAPFIKGTLPEKELNLIETELGKTKINLIKMNLIGENGYTLVIPIKEVNQAERLILENGEQYDLIEIHKTTVETLRIEAGIPRYGVDFDDTYLLPETGLDRTISYTKGCFPGQEVLARIDSRGNLHKKWGGFEMKGEMIPDRGNKIIKDEKEIGYVTSAAFSPTLKKVIGMGYLAKDVQIVGQEVTIEAKGERFPGRIKALPFYQSHHS